MAQTREGAVKIAAAKCGITTEEYIIRTESGLKRCTKCKEWKAAELFGKDSTRYDGRSAHCLECGRVKERKVMKGNKPSPMKGKQFSAEARANMGRKAGFTSPRKDIPLPPEQREHLSKVMRSSPNLVRGTAHHAYKDGQYERRKNLRRSVEYADWRKAIFTRDNFTCQDCGDNRGGNLQAHHIKGFAEHAESRFDVDNGITLCQTCHERRHLKPAPLAKCRRKKHPLPA